MRRRNDARAARGAHGSQADIDFQNVQDITTVFPLFQKSDVVDADNFSALRVDDLLIEQVAHHAKHVLVGMVWGEKLVLKVDAVGTNSLHLVVADAEPAGTGAHQKTVHAHRVDQRNQRGIAERADAAALQVIDLQADQFGPVKNFFRHRRAKGTDAAPPNQRGTRQLGGQSV